MKTKITTLALTFSIAMSLVWPHAIAGQSHNWTTVRAIPKGIDLIIERKRDDRVIGVLHAVTDDAIAVNADEGSFIIGKDNVSMIFHAIPRDKKKVMNRAALYGMLLGIGAGGAITALREPDGEEMPGVGGFFAGLGIGALAGKRYAKGKDRGPLLYSAR